MTRLIALAIVCASLVAAAPAAADSIAYIKDGDVWLSTPDGSRQQQVTHSGVYAYVSQADDGTFAVLAPGEKIQKLSRTGEVLSDISTYVSDGAAQSGPVNQFAGPFNPEISRDGSKIAFEWFNNTYTNTWDTSGCTAGDANRCYELSSKQGVGITHADRFTGFEEFGLLTGWIGPNWMSGDRLLRSNANVAINEDAVINNIGPGKGDDELKRWFWDDNQASGVEEVEITRDEKLAAGIAGWGSEELRVYRVLGDPMNAPEQALGPFDGENPDAVEPCIFFSEPVGGSFENLSFAPDGRSLAYSVGDGIWITDVPDVSGGCGPLPTNNKLVIPGGKHPHWGPADILPARAYEGPTACCAPPEEPPAAELAVTAAAAKLRGALTRGLTVKVQAPAAGRISGVAKVGAKRVAAGTKDVAAAGATTLRLKFTKAARRSLKRKRTARVSVAVTFQPASGAAQTQAAVVRLRR